MGLHYPIKALSLLSVCVQSTFAAGIFERQSGNILHDAPINGFTINSTLVPSHVFTVQTTNGEGIPQSGFDYTTFSLSIGSTEDTSFKQSYGPLSLPVTNGVGASPVSTLIAPASDASKFPVPGTATITLYATHCTGAADTAPSCPLMTDTFVATVPIASTTSNAVETGSALVTPAKK